ncbi:glycosyltransferase family 2 protein [Reinekea marinisedimentorum]|uniref:Cellulose synthase/poly-beta-1,6-N-acetylglucosamine synthase-like glycosyltransferase n=1 Tax=Reinekea marinisedimentorum TaxID=230495 RepID=A0A4R3I3Y9_9GAMM|nr:glycosyltransferase family 2 protein [Reinekea marinisedimentorum]TCS40300.1 cellulose synthase/poly-beta-1,6-N-acetylglucosamine synthase-like glycosyltransferase [Reinekea marinisedimentorum]
MITVLFWLLAICSVYSYFIYPLILKLLPNKKALLVVGESEPEKVKSYRYTLIVAAFNEEKRIEQKLQNMLELTFDSDRLEFIVASDCSDDGTDDIVKSYQEKGIGFVRATERLGKENAQLLAIKQAKGDILVFSDVATIMEPDALNKLERYFTDSSVGAVSSEDRFVSQQGEVAGEGAYLKYEMWLRKQESQLGGLIGLSGSFFAARKQVCEYWDTQMCSDFNTAFNCARGGYRSVSAPDVLGFYKDLADPSKEYARKVRTVLRGMTGLARHKEVLNFSKYGLFAFQVFSHKLMRWGVPWFLMALLIVSVLMADNGWFYQLALLGQILFYGVALFAHLSERFRSIGPVKLVYFFVQVNIALIDSAIKYFSGTRMTTWKPSAR